MQSSHNNILAFLPSPLLAFSSPMLKRQRPASPSMPSSSVPFVTSDSPADLIERHSKRRRTLPPVLDGSSRGWATLIADDDEDYYSDDNDEQETVASHFQHQQQSEYKSANNMLRELHTLHQHRLLFSPHSTTDARALPAPLNMSMTPDLKPYPQQQHTPSKGLMPQHFERLQTPQQQLTPTPTRIDRKSTHPDPLSEEFTRVSERYESTNRLLGSCFLSRRRALDSSDEMAGT